MQTLEAEFKPTFGVTGRIKSVGRPAPSKNPDSTLTVIPITVSLEDGSPRNSIKYYFCYEPAWLSDSLKITDLTTKQRRSFRQHIGNKALTAFLQVVPEDYSILDADIGELLADEYSDSSFQTILQKHLEDTEVLLRLRQQAQKTDEVDPDTGKTIYDRTEFYEIEKFLPLTAANITKMNAEADRAEERASEHEEEDRQPSFKVAWEVKGKAEGVEAVA